MLKIINKSKYYGFFNICLFLGKGFVNSNLCIYLHETITLAVILQSLNSYILVYNYRANVKQKKTPRLSGVFLLF